MPGERSTESGGLAGLLGIEPMAMGEKEARARLAVSEKILQPHGVVHGGAISALAESVCSKATDDAVKAEGLAAIGQSIQTTFLRPITAGHLNAVAMRRHRGRTTWIWDVEIADDDGRLCALARMTVAVRPRR
jgi:1,4-dihydroxy-2-naphthoyl-CoA hydrolase